MVLEDAHHRPLLDLRISVTDRCNMRCRYCMPREHFDGDHEFLPKEDILRFEEIVHVVRALIPHGLRKVRLTGGEPLLRRDLHKLVQQLRSTSQNLDIALTTNGLLLKNQLNDLYNAGLSRITVSLDALDEEIYRTMGDTNAHPSVVLEAIEFAQDIGLPVKVNAVIKKNVNESQVVPMVNEFGPRGTQSVSSNTWMWVRQTIGILIMLFQVKRCAQCSSKNSDHFARINPCMQAMLRRSIPQTKAGK